MAVMWDNWMRELYMWWAYQNEDNGGGFAAWWAAVRVRWDGRPRRVPCGFCERLVWSNMSDAPPFCNRSCFEAFEVYGGSAYVPDDGEIPF